VNLKHYKTTLVHHSLLIMSFPRGLLVWDILMEQTKQANYTLDVEEEKQAK
jgi:hypothetical protein